MKKNRPSEHLGLMIAVGGSQGASKDNNSSKNAQLPTATAPRTRGLTSDQRQQIVKECVEDRISPSDLAKKWRCRPASIRIWVRQSGQNLPESYKKPSSSPSLPPELRAKIEKLEAKKVEQKVEQKKLKANYNIKEGQGFWCCLDQPRGMSVWYECTICQEGLAKEGCLVVSSHEGTHYLITGEFSCRSTFVIYLLTCRYCNMQYVGQVIYVMKIVALLSIFHLLSVHYGSIKSGKYLTIFLVHNFSSDVLLPDLSYSRDSETKDIDTLRM